MSPKQRESVRGALTVKDIWDKLKTAYSATASVRRPQARALWDNLRADGYNSITEYDIALRKAVAEMIAAECTQEVSDEAQIRKTLATIPPVYESIADLIRSDSTKFKTYDKVYEQLLIKEANVKHRPIPAPNLVIYRQPCQCAQ